MTAWSSIKLLLASRSQPNRAKSLLTGKNVYEARTDAYRETGSARSVAELLRGPLLTSAESPQPRESM